MRIWFVNHYALPPGARGGPTRHIGLSRALTAAGHEVTIVASLFDHYQRRDHRPRPASGAEMLDGVGYRWIRTPSYGGSARRVLNMLTFASRVRRLAVPAGDTPDVIVGSSPHLFAAWAAQRLARRLRVPFVLEVRDLWPQSLVDLGEISDRHPLMVVLRSLEGSLYRTADHVVLVSPGAVDYVVERGADRARTSVVPNGVELAAGPGPERPPARRRTVVVYTGTLGLANGLEVVIDAAAHLAARGVEGILIRLIGPGPARDALAAQASAAGVGAMVSVEDPVPSGEVAAVLADADACLLVLRPSPVFRWGISPTKLFEYMAAGRPVIRVTDAPADAAVAAGASIPVPAGDAEGLADALEALHRMPADERHAMGMRGRRAVEAQHDFCALASAYEAVLHALADAPPSIGAAGDDG